MKKVLFLLLLVVTLTASAQYKPYASVGGSVMSGITSYGAEVGLYNDSRWLGVGVNSFSDNGKQIYFGQMKYYHKLTGGLFDLYGYGAVNVRLDGSKYTVLEPGFVTVINVSKKWAPQFSLTLPIEEGTRFFHPLSFGFGVNYWIK